MEIPISENSVFKDYFKLREEKHIILENKIIIIVPDHDCPYLLLAGDNLELIRLLDETHLEGFEVSPHMKIDWWNA